MPLTDLGPYPAEPGFSRAVELDEGDPLAHFKDRFVSTDPDLLYMDGNSLGRLPIGAADSIRDITERQWGERLIRAWNEGWWELQLELGDLLAPLIGARPGEVIISDSTSVNLYKLALAAMRARPGRTRIVTDDLNFPSDLYILEGIASMTGHTVEIVPSDGILGPVAGLAGTIDDRTALVCLSHTTFKSGYTYDLGAITRLAHDSGALILWDCSHSVGAVPIDLSGSGVDLAIGCTYKYLNGGPGAPAFLYVRSDLQALLESPITGWWGHAEPFAFDLHYRPLDGIRRFHAGTMPILSLGAVEAGVSAVSEAGMAALREKSVELTDFFIEQWETHLATHEFGLASPRHAERRGSHVSLSHPRAWQVTRALVDIGRVIPDYRVPDSIRFGLAPLYTGFVDVHTAIQRLKRLMEAGDMPDVGDGEAGPVVT